MSEFYNQGAVPLSSKAYIPRAFEEAVFQESCAGRWVLLLGPRQHGKTTGLVRLNGKFREAGLTAALVDLQGLPPCGSFPELLRGVADQIRRAMGRDAPRPRAEDQGDLAAWLEGLFPPGGPPVVVIIDEAGSIENPQFRNSFYGQIRQLSSLRAYAKPEAIAVRIRFVFAGTFRPETLVLEQNSPFNVCQTIETEDIPLDKAKALATQVDAAMGQFVERAYAIVGGQPFLLQTAFQETSRRSEVPPEAAFTEALEKLPQLAAAHLEGIFSKIIVSPVLVAKVARMVHEGATEFLPADSDCSFLQVLGLARREGPNLVFRNSFYAANAKASPQLVATPGARITRAAVFGFQKADLAFMHNPDLREVCFSCYSGAAKAHGTASFRLALTGFGAATEAMLMDLLKGLQPADLRKAITDATSESDQTKRPSFNRFENQADPMTWRLVNLINVARKVKVSTSALEPSPVLREWRNLIHPALAVQHLVDESKLEPESVAASALFMMLLRDITS